MPLLPIFRKKSSFSLKKNPNIVRNWKILLFHSHSTAIFWQFGGERKSYLKSCNNFLSLPESWNWQVRVKKARCERKIFLRYYNYGQKMKNTEIFCDNFCVHISNNFLKCEYQSFHCWITATLNQCKKCQRVLQNFGGVINSVFGKILITRAQELVRIYTQWQGSYIANFNH